MNEKVSKSKVFLFLCISFILGVFIQSIIKIPEPVWLGILVLAVILISVYWTRSKKTVIAGLCLIVIFFGAWRYIMTYDIINLVSQFNSKGQAVVVGIIAGEPDVRSDNARYKVNVIWAQNKEFFGNNYILVTAKKYPVFEYGDEVKITGKLQEPKDFEDFDYKKYLSKDDIYSVVYYPEMEFISSGNGNWLYSNLFKVKDIFENSISKILPEPHASFLAGLLLGEKKGFSQQMKDALSATGTTHIVALSGYNISIIAIALIALFNFFLVRRQVSFWLAVVFICFFVLMTGAAASVVRAAIMGILALLAKQVGRLYSIRNALVFAGAVMVCLNPKILVFDIGFQLSFLATLGLVYIAPLIEKKMLGEEQKGGLLGWKNILIATLAAQLAVLPILILNFGKLSLISPLANLLVLPAIPLAMLLGFVMSFLGIFWTGLAQVLAIFIWIVLEYILRVINFLANVPFAYVNWRWGWFSAVLYFLILILYILSKKEVSQNNI